MTAPYVLEFTLPGLPRMTNASGRSKHWCVMRQEADKWKKAIWLVTAGKLPREPLERAKLTLTRHSSTSPDADGLVSGFKHVIDGLVLAMVLDDDKFKNIGMPDYRWVQVKPKQGCITVRVEEVME